MRTATIAAALVALAALALPALAAVKPDAQGAPPLAITHVLCEHTNASRDAASSLEP